MRYRTPSLEEARFAGLRAIALLLVFGAAACARRDAAWRNELANPRSEPFEHDLAAIALAAQASDGLGGVPTHLLEVLEHRPEVLGPPAQTALLGIGTSALPEMAMCLAQNTFMGELSLPTLETAIERHGAAAIHPLVDAMPPPPDPGHERVTKVVVAIGKDAVDPLVEILRAGPKDRSVRAAILLGRLRWKASGAIDALLAAASSGDAELARAALSSLPSANPLGWRIEPVLRTALEHADPGIRDAATAALAYVLLQRGASTRPDDASKKRIGLLREAARLGEAADRPYVEALVPLRSARARFAADVLLLRAANWSLASRTTGDAAEMLRGEEARLVRAGPLERRLAALEIGRRGRRALDSIPALQEAIRDPDEGLRFCAALSLALVAIDAGRAIAFGGLPEDGARR